MNILRGGQKYGRRVWIHFRIQLLKFLLPLMVFQFLKSVAFPTALDWSILLALAATYIALRFRIL